jgi:hypothetical protein
MKRTKSEKFLLEFAFKPSDLFFSMSSEGVSFIFEMRSRQTKISRRILPSRGQNTNKFSQGVLVEVFTMVAQRPKRCQRCKDGCHDLVVIDSFPSRDILHCGCTVFTSTFSKKLEQCFSIDGHTLFLLLLLVLLVTNMK